MAPRDRLAVTPRCGGSPARPLNVGTLAERAESARAEARGRRLATKGVSR